MINTFEKKRAEVFNKWRYFAGITKYREIVQSQQKMSSFEKINRILSNNKMILLRKTFKNLIPLKEALPDRQKVFSGIGIVLWKIYLKQIKYSFENIKKLLSQKPNLKKKCIQQLIQAKRNQLRLALMVWSLACLNRKTINQCSSTFTTFQAISEGAKKNISRLLAPKHLFAPKPLLALKPLSQKDKTEVIK